MTIYENGIEKYSEDTSYNFPFQSGNGQMDIGRCYEKSLSLSAMVDELTLWNSALDLNDVQALYNMSE